MASPMTVTPACSVIRPSLTVSAAARGAGGECDRKVVISMWWVDIVVPVLFILAIYGFASWAGFNTRWLTGKTDRRAEDLYDEYGNHQRRRHRRS
jgi:hypothetical protein